MSKVILYYTSVSCNVGTKKKQTKIQQTLTGKKIEYELKDISASEDVKKEMRRVANDEKAMPPQLCNGDQYCGDFDAFDDAVEMEILHQFLKLE